jgi:hypothetical protein
VAGVQQQLHPINHERKNTMSEHALAESALNQFTGTEKWYRHALNRKVLLGALLHWSKIAR